MKKVLYFFVCILINKIGFSQQQLHDGIYLVDSPVTSKDRQPQPGRAIIHFNHGFVNEDPDNYAPLVIKTLDYFTFELAGQPVLQNREKENSMLLLELTAAAKEKLTAFTTSNLMKNIVVVVNDEALAVYKITQPVVNGLIKIASCNGQACNQILKNIKSNRKI